MMCITAIRSFLKKSFMVDGPGMENTHCWDSFCVARSDSYAQHNFHITVQCHERGCVVRGILRDHDGTEYNDERDIVLPEEACRKIYALQPHNLCDLKHNLPEQTDEEDCIALDMPEVHIEVGYSDGTQQEKRDEDQFSIKVYEIVLPYFRKKFPFGWWKRDAVKGRFD
jgi:hypothetical protein